MAYLVRMKINLLCFACVCFVMAASAGPKPKNPAKTSPAWLDTYSVQSDSTHAGNVILVTLDGFRWQELFGGAQRNLVGFKKFVSDVKSLKAAYWSKSKQERREKLMPFMWGTVANTGQIYGNRKAHSRMFVSNKYRFSYPGYSEIFCGFADKRINSNSYPDNPNKNIFDFLAAQPAFANNIAAISTWNAFTHIINSNRNGVPVYTNLLSSADTAAYTSNFAFQQFTTTIPVSNGFITDDTLTYHFAKEYISKFHPRFAFIGMDETDHFGHAKRYDAYLHTANLEDAYLADLWNMLQQDSVYANNTTLIITCDHGRGKIPRYRWQSHGVKYPYANETWMAVIGPQTPAIGEVHGGAKLYHNQIAQTIAALFGYTYTNSPSPGPAINAVLGK